MNKLFSYVMFTAFLYMVLFFYTGTISYAEPVYENEDTDYVIIINDYSYELYISRNPELVQTCVELTDYGNVVIVIWYDEDLESSAETVADFYKKCFGETSGLMVFVDFFADQAWFHGQGDIITQIGENSWNELCAEVQELEWDYGDLDVGFVDFCFSEALERIRNKELLADCIDMETNYRVEILDHAKLLTLEQKEQLIPYMMPITKYGNVAFVTVEDTGETAEENARNYYMNLFGTDSGTLFLIDMTNRYIWIHSDGEVYKTINSGYADSITDNVYKLATDKHYLACAQAAYEQIYTLLEGGKIAQPMKYICNIFIGLLISIMVNFTWMAVWAYRQRPKTKEMLDMINHSFQYEYRNLEKNGEKREKITGSGGSSSAGIGGGRGGVRSGGGGGHRF